VGGRSVRVLVADDQPAFRKAARAVLDASEQFELVGEARSGEEAVSGATTLEPDLVLMDVHMEGIGGLEATRRIVTERPEIAVILVSSYRAEDMEASAADSGAIAFLPKDEFGVRSLSGLWATRAEHAAPTETRGPPSRDG
jgi:DNA-binding NarL/FixJ family response regulator